MEDKKPAVIICYFLCLSFFICAQPAKGKNYYIAENETETVLYQRLSWEAFEDILGYEFELEQKNESGGWMQIEKKTVEKNFTDLSLSPGFYRFRVSVINLLGQSEALSDYQNFNVLIAYQPEVDDISPNLIYFDNIFDNRLIVKGKNFLDGTEFSLEKPLAPAVVLTPVEIDKNGKRVVFELNMNRFLPGDYVFCVRDKSGLYDKSQTLSLRFQKPLHMYLSTGYAFTGFTGKNVFTQYYKRDFVPLGGVFRFTVCPFKIFYGNFGFNFNASAFLLDKKNQEYKISGYVFMPQINASYVYPIIKQRLNMDVHIGTGAVFLMNSRFTFPTGDLKSPVYWYWGMSVNAGTALQFYVWKKLYLELNMDHIISLRKGFPVYMYQPQVSIGWEF